VETGIDRGRSWLRVTDNGAGIPSDKLESIFEPYVSAHERTGQPGSMGLGLSVARDLARLMGGSVVAWSRPGEAVFELAFPGAGKDHDSEPLADTA
jgi:signal transduction histidine kinase